MPKPNLAWDATPTAKETLLKNALAVPESLTTELGVQCNHVKDTLSQENAVIEGGTFGCQTAALILHCFA